MLFFGVGQVCGLWVWGMSVTVVMGNTAAEAGRSLIGWQFAGQTQTNGFPHHSQHTPNF